MKKERGQIILILVLIMTVALAIGISVIQRSLSDVSTASKVEQSSRAFSAAEAGIEQALRGTTVLNISFPENNSTATVPSIALIPCVPGSDRCSIPTAGRQDPLEYPPLAMEEVAHVWLADFSSAANPPPQFYKQPSLDVYWGDPNATDKAALELTLIYYSYNSSNYVTQKWFLESNFSRGSVNKFNTNANCPSGGTKPANSLYTYQCKFTLASLPSSATNTLMLIRARLLYNNLRYQPFAVQAVGNCGQDCSLPPQARNLVSTGTAGQTQRKVRLYQVLEVVPTYFDYAIFSTGSINK